MKKSGLLILIAMVFGSSGCASHYYKLENDMVNIYLVNPEAAEISFASSLNGFEPRRAQKIDKKTWLFKTDGDVSFRYFYMVDQKVFLPDCRFKEKDDFGSENCIFIPDYQ